MLIGTYRHSVDAKKRMRVPSKFKGELGSNFIITKGTCGNLFAFSSDKFSALYDKLTNLPLFDEEAQKPVRKFLASAFEAEEDGQGRVLHKLPDRRQLLQQLCLTQQQDFSLLQNWSLHGRTICMYRRYPC